MHFSIILSTIDSALGRLDYDSLSEQALMELFIDGMEDDVKQDFQDSDHDYLDIEAWHVLKFNSDGKVESISMGWAVLGSLSFEFIPKSVKNINFFDCLLTGSIETSLLPYGLEEFQVAATENLSGTFDFAKLPSPLVACKIPENQFFGSADLTKLPKGLRTLEINHNRFTGTVSLRMLPRELKNFAMDSNQFHGSLDFSALPTSLYEFTLSENNFSGTLDFEYLPLGLHEFWINTNRFSGELRLDQAFENLTEIKVLSNLFEGTAIVHRNLHQYIDLRANRIKEVADEDGNICKCSKVNGFVDTLVQE